MKQGTQTVMTGSRQRDKSNDFKHRTAPHSDAHQPTVYEIRIKGHLGSQWQEWFEDLTITPEEYGSTILTGPVVDQAALHGLIKRVRDLGVPLISVNRIEPGQSEASDV